MPAGETSENIVLALLRAGETVLTPNQRAARTLRRAFDHAQQLTGLTQWQPPTVLPVDTWLDTLHRALLLTGDETRLLLNRTQQHSLWREIIAADSESLRSPDTLAELAADAWAVASAHNGRQSLREIGISTDTRAFERWALAFDLRCHRAGYLAPAQLPETLAEHLAQGTLTLPPSLYLVDFDHLPPALETFFDHIDRAGYPVTRLTTTRPAPAQLHIADEDLSELQAAAHWCRELLAANPDTRIAIVLPNQADRRFPLERTFAQILAPADQPITAAATPPLYEFSLGTPLAQLAPIATALDLLQWTLAPLPLPSITALCLTLHAAQFDAHTLRRAERLLPELTLKQFLDLPHLPPHLAAPLHSLRRTAQSERLADSRPFHDWADTFRILLEAAGWSAPTHQLRTRWDSALDELATLDFEPHRPTASEALTHLTRIARQTIFAPESLSAPIQILGPLELGGIPFDALWFLGADDLTWPPPTSPSPLLPWAFQQSLGMPGADATRDRRHAQTLTHRIATSAAQVVFSYAQNSGEGTRRPSPYLADLALTPLTPPQIPPAPPQIPLELYQDHALILPLPDRPIHGGASILQAQAACPFRAFAERRLYASAPETSTAGLSPRQRGSLVHNVMEHFWAQLHDQPTFLALPLPDRLSLLDQCIARAVTPQAAHQPWEHAYLEVQCQRLRNLLRPWLEVEAVRPPFQVLAQESEAKDIALGPLRLSVRVDRVDETEHGTIILDYKTGEARPSDWLTDRPDQPQLPLYAVLAEQPPAALAFALLRPGKGLALRGFADDPSVFGKTSRNDLTMQDQIEEWRRVLQQLAHDFADGIATVAPKSYPKTCQFCSQRILCRLDPTTLAEAAEAEEEEPTYA